MQNDVTILTFIINSILFGVGLAMDAFSVSLANGLSDPHMKKRRMALIAGTFCFFQIIMPLIGWICVRTVVERFSALQKFIPWIALLLLGYIGGKMLVEGIQCCKEGSTECKVSGLTFGALMVQGIATSIDALSVGFTIADLTLPFALTEALIIGVVTFGICIGGLIIGKIFGNKLAGKATILGGVILIGIGIEIFLTGILG